MNRQKGEIFFPDVKGGAGKDKSPRGAIPRDLRELDHDWNWHPWGGRHLPGVKRSERYFTRERRVKVSPSGGEKRVLRQAEEPPGKMSGLRSLFRPGRRPCRDLGRFGGTVDQASRSPHVRKPES